MEKYSMIMDQNTQYWSEPMYRFNALLIKMPDDYFIEIDKLDQNLCEKVKAYKIAE